MKKKILYIDMDGVLVDFKSGLDRIAPDIQQEYAGKEDNIPGVYALMEPKRGAVEAFLELSGLYDTYILSTAPWRNPSAWSDKLLWVKNHLGDAAYKRLILSHHKNLNRGHYLVDDKTKNGAGEFASRNRGKLLLFDSPKFPDWAAVLEYLRERSGD